jgi:hypothetical protein
LFKLAHHFALVSDKLGDDGLPRILSSNLPPKTVQYNAYSVFGTR